MNSLNETQMAAVCQAFCAMSDVQDVAARTGIKCITIIDDSGDLFVSPDTPNRFPHDGIPSFLRGIKDRTPAEIDAFKNDWCATLEKAQHSLRQQRIQQLKAELAELEPFEDIA